MPKRLGKLSARHVIFTIGIGKEGKITVDHASLEKLQRTGLKSRENSSVSEPEHLGRQWQEGRPHLKMG